MNKLFAVSAVLFAFALPSVAQGTHLSLSDQKRFDSYYSRWQSYKATNNQKEVRSMEGRMQDVYRHYGIPANTPYRNLEHLAAAEFGVPTIGTEIVIAIGQETVIATVTGIAPMTESTMIADAIAAGTSIIATMTTMIRVKITTAKPTAGKLTQILDFG